MTRGQLAILPVPDGRRAERRVVNLAARLREPGAALEEVEINNLSVNGFMARGDFKLSVGAHVWLRLSGLEPQNCQLIWIEDDKAGFEFVNPLHPVTVEMLVEAGKKTVPRNHFGYQGSR